MLYDMNHIPEGSDVSTLQLRWFRLRTLYII